MPPIVDSRSWSAKAEFALPLLWGLFQDPELENTIGAKADGYDYERIGFVACAVDNADT